MKSESENIHIQIDDVRVAHRRISELELQLDKLRVDLFGDEVARELYVKNRATNTAPNIPEPPLGAIDALTASIGTNIVQVGNLGRRIDEQVGSVKKSLEWVAAVEKLISPLVAEANGSPLGWAHIATKEYVDKAVERIAGALRSELNPAMELAAELLSIFNMAAQSVKGRARLVRDAIMLTSDAEKKRQHDEEERRKRPSRVQSLVHAITGYTKPTNGASQ